MFYLFDKYKRFECWLLNKLCNIRGYHKYVNRKCNICGFQIKVMDGGKKDYKMSSRYTRERQRKIRNKTPLSNKGESKDC